MNSQQTTKLSNVLSYSAIAGLVIGALQGGVGYFPRLNVVFVAASAALVGAVAAAGLGLVLYFVAFRHSDVMSVLRAVVWVSGICGVISSLAIRWWTQGEGAVMSMFVTPVIAVISAAAVRVFILFQDSDA
jgi:hypothetical protein